jgi:hypothetical protein
LEVIDRMNVATSEDLSKSIQELELNDEDSDNEQGRRDDENYEIDSYADSASYADSYADSVNYSESSD